MGDERLSAGARAPVLAPGTRAAVTGASGFLGGRLVEMLAEQGVDVTCLVRSPHAGHRLQQTGARLLTLDLADPGAVQAALEGVGVAFHCAYDWADAAWNHRAISAVIAGCQRNGCRLVHVSSYVVYQLPDEGEVTEGLPGNPSASGYAHAKRELEAAVLRAVQEQSLSGAVVQPTLVYGPFSGPFTNEPAEMLRFGTVVLPDQGEGACNAVYVDDVVSAMVLAARHPSAIGQRFLVSGPDPVTWREFYEEMARAVGAKGPQYRAAEAITRGNTRMRKLLRFAADPERVIRRVAQDGRVRHLVQGAVGVLPARPRQVLADRLLTPPSRRPGHVHLPDGDRLGFLRSRATVGSAKARRELGYAPAFDFAAGMVPTARYLREVWEQGGNRTDAP